MSTPVPPPIACRSEVGRTRTRDPGIMRSPQHAALAAERPKPYRQTGRVELGRTLSGLRRRAGLTQAQVVAQLGWRKTRVSLIKTGRARLDGGDATAPADVFWLNEVERAALLELTGACVQSLADEMDWVTSTHSGRPRRRRGP